MTSHPEFDRKTTCEEVIEVFGDVVKGKTSTKLDISWLQFEI